VALTEEMRQEIHKDLYGVQQPEEWEESAEVNEEMLQLLEEAIEQLPDRQKKEYCLARKLVPKLVQNESDPIKFLRCEKLDCKVKSSYIKGT